MMVKVANKQKTPPSAVSFVFGFAVALVFSMVFFVVVVPNRPSVPDTSDEGFYQGLYNSQQKTFGSMNAAMVIQDKTIDLQRKTIEGYEKRLNPFPSSSGTLTFPERGFPYSADNYCVVGNVASPCYPKTLIVPFASPSMKTECFLREFDGNNPDFGTQVCFDVPFLAPDFRADGWEKR